MKKKRLLVYLENHLIKFEDEEEKLTKMLEMYRLARMQNTTGFMSGPNFIVNIQAVQAMMIVDNKPTPQEEYIDKMNKRLDEGEDWRYGKDQDED